MKNNHWKLFCRPSDHHSAKKQSLFARIRNRQLDRSALLRSFFRLIHHVDWTNFRRLDARTASSCERFTVQHEISSMIQPRTNTSDFLRSCIVNEPTSLSGIHEWTDLVRDVNGSVISTYYSDVFIETTTTRSFIVYACRAAFRIRSDQPPL